MSMYSLYSLFTVPLLEATFREISADFTESSMVGTSLSCLSSKTEIGIRLLIITCALIFWLLSFVIANWWKMWPLHFKVTAGAVPLCALGDLWYRTSSRLLCRFVKYTLMASLLDQLQVGRQLVSGRLKRCIRAIHLSTYLFLLKSIPSHTGRREISNFATGFSPIPMFLYLSMKHVTVLQKAYPWSLEMESVWVKDTEYMWLLGRIVDVKKDDMCVVETSKGRVVTKLKDTMVCDPTHTQMFTDIAKMNNLHEAPLLDLLRRRYIEDCIYTYVSDILIAVSSLSSSCMICDLHFHSHIYIYEHFFTFFCH